MTTATVNAPATGTPIRGWAGVPCVKCVALDSLRMDVGEVTSFVCNQCDESFTADDVREAVAAVAKWAPLLKWIELAPVID